MSQFIFLLLCALLIGMASCESSLSDQLMSKIHETLVDKYCPFLNIHGIPHCPIPSVVSIPTVNKNVTILGAGLGYNIMTRTLTFPIHHGQVVQHATMIESNTGVLRFDNVTSFLDRCKSQGAAQHLGGIWSASREQMEEFTTAFFDDSAAVHTTQKTYETHASIINDAANLTDEFQAVLALLPIPFDARDPYHQYMYMQFFNTFGTHVVTRVRHGGIVLRQTSVKMCYGGTGITDDLIQELEHDILKEPKGSYAYLRYRRLGILRVYGGNPEVDDLLQRIVTFVQAPAWIEFDHVPHDEHLMGTPVQSSVRDALAWYRDQSIKEHQDWESILMKRIQQAQLERYKGPKLVRFFKTYYAAAQSQHYRSYCPRCGPQTFAFPHDNPQCVVQLPQRTSHVLAAGQRANVGTGTSTDDATWGIIMRDVNTGMWQFRASKVAKEAGLGDWDTHEHVYVMRYDPSKLHPRYANTWPYELAMVVDCEPVIVEFPSSFCLPHRRLECRCAGY